MSVKAFDLVPAIERVSLGDKVQTSIECLECCGKEIYVGTSESFIIHYHLEDKSQPDGTYRFHSKKLMQKYLGYKKPVSQLKAVSALNKIFALCDGNFIVLNIVDLEAIPSMSKLKGVTSFCLNENPIENNPFSVEICLSRKKQILLYHVTDDKIIHIKDINLPEPPITMEMDRNFACVALITKYIIVNMETSYVQDLFPYETGSIVPIVKRITKKEFLLSGPSALGMFVTTEGTSERPPIRWDTGIVSVAYAHPYLLVLSHEFLTVYSVVNHEQKQRVAFRGGICMDNFDGKLYVSSADIICALVPVPWEKQVQALLVDKKVSEALELAEYANKSGLSKEQCKNIMQKIRQQAGFIEFSLFHFDKAKEYFQLGCLDIRELISLYPELLSSSSTFVRSVPPLHEIANIEQMCSNDSSLINQCKEFLLQYLEELRFSQNAVNYKFEIDSAILKLYAATNSPNLLSLVASTEIFCDNKECIQYLTQCEKYHALAIFYHTLKENEKALQIWARLIVEEIQDPDFPGLKYFVEFLGKLNDYHLVWKYVDFVLERDEELGIEIFTNRPENEPSSERMRPELIVDYLHRFPVALIKYLEYLVFNKKLEKEKFHTHLAILYLDNVLKLIKSEDEVNILENERRKLQFLLRSSSLYRVQILLGKALEHKLYIECSILYSKLQEHQKALRILVHELEDYVAAEDYCFENAKGRDEKVRHKLFHTLLEVYLDSNLDENVQEQLIAPAVGLLNSELAEFDAAKVLKLIPSRWSVAVVDQFLNKALRNSLHKYSMYHIENALARGENLQVKYAKIHLQNAPLIMTEDKLCSVCNRPFMEPAFVWYPNGVITHPQCAKHHITCPVTGKTFKCKKPIIR